MNCFMLLIQFIIDILEASSLHKNVATCDGFNSLLSWELGFTSPLPLVSTSPQNCKYNSKLLHLPKSHIKPLPALKIFWVRLGGGGSAPNI